MKLKLNDQVIVISGKDKGKKGKITHVYPKTARVLVGGINQYRRHLKKRSDKTPGGIVSLERPLPAANVMLLCPHCHKPTRVGYVITKTAEKYRRCRLCDQQIDPAAKV
ncbi:50S ribosomal protein L24 [Microgenomates group bacterium RBG_16_45_19]|nr:ribosomal protein L24 [uncultured bacterium]OGV95978.1 MAG: 50S ribosomal protein L24 [Microgenomates group bacterium RBG_16_45_19]